MSHTATRMGMVLVTATLAASGCIVYDTGSGPGSDPDIVVVEDNYAPDITWGEAGCYWDSYYYDYIWYFEADVDDPNSPYDVVAVFADVYDDRSGAWVDSFELYPTDDPFYWFSDWLGGSTYLDCQYEGYVVDFWAYDSFDAADAMTVVPYTYGPY